MCGVRASRRPPTCGWRADCPGHIKPSWPSPDHAIPHPSTAGENGASRSRVKAGDGAGGHPAIWFPTTTHNTQRAIVANRGLAFRPDRI